MEVDRDVAEGFRNKFGDGTVVKECDGRERLDLGEACRIQLVSNGITEENVFLTGECTSCSDGYFSYRTSGGVTGRQAGLVAIL